MSGKRFKASDKKVQKMNRDGLVEQNLSTGATERVSQREKDFQVGGAAIGQPPPQNTLATTPQNTNNTQASPRVRPGKPDAGAAAATPAAPSVAVPSNTPPVEAPAVKYTRQSKLRHAEAAVERADKRLEALRKKQPHKKRLVSETVVDKKTQKPKRRLHFEDVPAAAAKKPRLITTGVKAAVGMAMLGVHRKLYQSGRENAGVEATHKSEMVGEAGLRAVSRYRRLRPQRLAKKAVKLEKQAIKARTNLSFERAVKRNPALAKKNFLQRYLHKKKIKKQYVKQAQKNIKKAKKAAKESAKTTKKVIMFVARHPFFTIIAVLLLLFFFSFQSCMNMGLVMISGTGGVFESLYPAEDYDINQASLYYSEKEADLMLEAKQIEADNPDYDEYRYVGEASHDPHELIAYLCAVSGEFTFADIIPQLDALFDKQYTLSSEEITETRTDDNDEEYKYKILVITIEKIPMETLTASKMDDEEKELYAAYIEIRGGHFYFSPPFSGWTAFVTSNYGYRISPIDGTKEFHDGIDIALPVGTNVYSAQDGTVTFAGNNGGYGLCVIIENADGLKSLYAHLDRVSVSVGQTVENGEAIGKSGDTGTVTGPHLHLSVYINGQAMNPAFFVDPDY